jgi:hypothetical protein
VHDRTGDGEDASLYGDRGRWRQELADKRFQAVIMPTGEIRFSNGAREALLG